MRLLLAAFLICGLPLITQGKKNAPKQFETKEIVGTSDSLLNSLLGTLSDYARLDSGSYYTYSTRGKTVYSVLYRTRKIKLFTPEKTRKNFIEARLIYHFVMPYPDCKWYDAIKGSIEIALDTALQLVNRPDISFIPDMVTAHEKCHFIPMDTAIQIAMKDSIKLGVTHPYAFIRYRAQEKKFVWVVLSTLWNDRDFYNNKPTLNDMVVIDAINANILTHQVMPFAPGIK